MLIIFTQTHLCKNKDKLSIGAKLLTKKKQINRHTEKTENQTNKYRKRDRQKRERKSAIWHKSNFLSYVDDI